MSFSEPFARCVLSLLAVTLVQSAFAQGKCERRTPEDVRLLVKARDAKGTIAALKCRRELLADTMVRGSIGYAFTSEAYQANRDFLAAMRKSGVDFLLDFAPLLPDDRRDNHVTPLGAAVQTANLDAVQWLLSGTKPNALRDYRRLAYTAVEPLLGQSNFDDSRMKLVEILRTTSKAGLPLDAEQYSAFREASLNWWRTQDSIDYTDNSFTARNAAKPLASSAAPLWSQVADLLAPGDQAERLKLSLDAAKIYVGSTLSVLDYQCTELTGALGRAGTVPGSLTVDGSGVVGTSPMERVPRELVSATLSKIEVRATRLRSAVKSRSGGELPDWASTKQSTAGSSAAGCASVDLCAADITAEVERIAPPNFHHVPVRRIHPNDLRFHLNISHSAAMLAEANRLKYDRINFRNSNVDSETLICVDRKRAAFEQLAKDLQERNKQVALEIEARR